MRPHDANDHTAAELTNEQVAQLLRSSMTEIAVRAGLNTLEGILDQIRESLDEDTLGRLRDERDRMLFTAAVMADIASLPSTEPPSDSDDPHGMYL